MIIYTIGFTKKSAEKFFETLKEKEISLLLDVRLRNNSQLSGFAKGRDLNYFCKEILNSSYIHDIRLAPTKELLDLYKKGKCSWLDYEEQFSKILLDRNAEEIIKSEYLEAFDKICLLCSEDKPEKCHRRLVAEFIQSRFTDKNIHIMHL